jgi:hypothetical protein
MSKNFIIKLIQHIPNKYTWNYPWKGDGQKNT